MTFQPVENPHDFWDVNCASGPALESLRVETGHVDHPQRVAFRQFLTDMKIKSVLDCGAGPGWEVEGIRRDGIDVDYAALEVTRAYRQQLMALRVRVMNGSIDAIPHADKSFELVYQRHVLEHVEKWEYAIAEMVRCATQYVFIAMNKPFGTGSVRRRRHGIPENVYSFRDFSRAADQAGGFICTAEHLRAIGCEVLAIK